MLGIGFGKDDLRNIIRDALAEIFGVPVGSAIYGGVSATDTTVGAAISVVLDTGGRPFFEVRVVSSGAGTFTVEGSTDGIVYGNAFTIVLLGPGEDWDGGFNAFRYIRVTNPAALNHTVFIVASR